MNFLTFILYLLLLSMLEWLCYTLVGIGFLSFLGFQYESYKSVVIFFIICYILMIPVDYYTAIILSLFRSESKATRFQERCIDFILYLALASLVIGVVEYLFPGIFISPRNQVLFVVLCYMLEVCSEYLILKKL